MTIDTQPYQHFSFDLWLTLIRSNADYKRKRDELFQSFFAINQDFDQVQKAVRYYDVLCNKISENTGLHIHRHTIYLLILSKLEINIANISKDCMEDFCQQTEELFLNFLPQLMDENIHQILQQIKTEGKTANILSNTGFIHGETLRKVLEHYELAPYFTFQIYSDETGFSKPNQKMFDIVHQELNLIKPIKKTDIVHIGDNKKADFEGALNAGFKAILI